MTLAENGKVECNFVTFEIVEGNFVAGNVCLVGKKLLML